MNAPHKGWTSRGYLPHFDSPDVVQAITFRLWDALPRHVVEMMANTSGEEVSAERRAQMEGYLNAGFGAGYLKQPRIADLVQNALLFFDGQRYRLLAWVIMPNHVHVIAEMRDGFPLRSVIHSWKSFTASNANRILGREGPFQYPDFFDRYIRNERHLSNAIRYVHENPVKASFVEAPKDWLYSIARFA